MFEQFKENIQLTGERYGEARREIRSGVFRFKSSPRQKKALWIAILAGLAVSSVASGFSVPWYYQVLLVIGIVLVPLWVWEDKGKRH